MSREEIEKLMGGYATDTLNAAEKRALFEASLDDQALFDALAKEQALRDVLEDTSARQQLLEALGPAREPGGERRWPWLRRPATLGLVACGLAAVLIVGGLALKSRREARREALMADVISAPPAAAPAKQFQAPFLKKEAARQLPKPPVLARDQRVVNSPLQSVAQLPPPPPPAPAAPGVAGALGGQQQVMASATQMVEVSPAPAANFVARAPLAAPMARAKAAMALADQPSVKYNLLVKDSDGQYAPAPAGTVFHLGDSVRIQAEASDAGTIYLFQRGADGRWNTVQKTRAEKGQRYVLPSAGGLGSDVPAQLDLTLVFTRGEQPDLDAADLEAVTQSTAGAGRFTAADGPRLSKQTAAPAAVHQLVLEFR